MSEEINISCPACNVAFCVPVELCGEIAECEECQKTFKIRHPNEKAEDNLQDTNTGSIDNNIIDTTNTVKLSRSEIRMIPEINDSFKLGSPNFEAKPIIRKGRSVQRTKAKEETEQLISCPEWIEIEIKEPEKIIKLKEDIIYPWKSIFMICILIIIGISIAHFGNILIVVMLLITVAGSILLIATKSKKALIVTNQRSLFIIGKIKIEVENSL